jgi:BirA family transcriptional regulator, biotin operon repressor / biotin---[acetyl-CoA-carboxylase] ligase
VVLCTLFKNSNLLSIGHSFIELESVDSSNNYAMGQVHAGTVSHGAIFFAREQWAGKGQRGKTWISSPGDNIMMSIVLEPVFLPITQQFRLSSAIALSCHDLIRQYTSTEQPTIKWPNDLYWRDRKAGGILMENKIRGDRWLFAVAGIGINVNQLKFPATLHNPISLAQITGRRFDAVELAKELGRRIDYRFEQLRAEIQTDNSSTPSLLEEYNARLYKRGKTATLSAGTDVFETLILGVSATGELLTRDQVERRFKFGEVEWIIGG